MNGTKTESQDQKGTLPPPPQGEENKGGSNIDMCKGMVNINIYFRTNGTGPHGGAGDASTAAQGGGGKDVKPQGSTGDVTATAQGGNGNTGQASSGGGVTPGANAGSAATHEQGGNGDDKNAAKLNINIYL